MGVRVLKLTKDKIDNMSMCCDPELGEHDISSLKKGLSVQIKDVHGEPTGEWYIPVKFPTGGWWEY